ncbi:HAMP domain-containing sensor histidine kinase [uncultured Bacteroides sp.]|uniref:sensor histidine kinase n=1 Tax=uncultured Bacteroides sp. TaxID=162156 RepID=UPI0023CB52CB|nr:HAMP domain-containing sensor histidine kinase [uncultured Bacteroides sp.]MDE5701627.1 HAMP domain-containing histidine kinase [Bacteroides sp.]MDE6173229.1 HAMP domain-containing histidine kinase [Bacteroides sp.]
MKKPGLIKFWLVLAAILIAIASLCVSHTLINDLFNEERGRMELWAEAMKNLQTADENTDLTMVLKVLNANHTIPVIVANQADEIQTYRNIRFTSSDTLAVLKENLSHFGSERHCIRIDLGDGDNGDYLNVYYGPSLLLTRLAVYPYIQLAVVLIFVLVAIFALLSSKKAEQNKVWVGLSKETAHQLGTPISSLMAWTELLKSKYPLDDLLPAMAEDVERLQVIANRFSKIGSIPELESVDIKLLLEKVTDYMGHRTSDKVKIITRLPDEYPMLRLNAALFEWVIENLCKNAIDAMGGVGTLIISVQETSKYCCIDVADTGKGIDRRNFETVFAPGYTTKKRGWGLGLSLARRIVVDYHSGRIFVKQSEINKGTIFRIELKK